MPNKNLKEFTVNVRIKAIVSYTIHAESLEDAVTFAHANRRNVKFENGLDYIDGNEEIIGVDGSWDID